MWTAITSFFTALAESIGLIRDRSKLKNTAEMQANAAALAHQESVDTATKEVTAALNHPDEPETLDALRKGVAK